MEGNADGINDAEDPEEVDLKVVRKFLEKGYVPKEAIEAYLKELRSQQAGVFVTRGEFDKYKKRPLEAMISDFDAEAAKSLQDKLGGPEGISKAAERAIKKLIGEVDDEVRKQFDTQLVSALNRIYGTDYQTTEEAVKSSRSKRIRQTMLAVGVALTSTLALGFAGYTFIANQRKTAAGATKLAEEGIARTAVLGETVKGMDNKFSGWQLKHDAALSAEKAEKDRQLGELEQRVTGQITNKLDKTEWGARAADLEKGIADVQAAYKQIDALLQGEITKDASREKAYGQYKSLVESSKTEIDGLRLRITELQTGFSTKEYTDAEIGKMRTGYDGMKADLRQKYDSLLGVIKKMQNCSNQNNLEEAEKPQKNK